MYCEYITMILLYILEIMLEVHYVNDLSVSFNDNGTTLVKQHDATKPLYIQTDDELQPVNTDYQLSIYNRLLGLTSLQLL